MTAPDEPQVDTLLPVFREALAAVKADEAEVLREIAEMALEPEWPTTDTRGE